MRAYLDSPTYSWFQRLRLTVELIVAPGYHIYGRPVPEGYTPLTIQVDPIPGVEVGDLKLPAPERFVVEGLDEEFWVHEGTVRASLPLTFTLQPGAGDLVVRATVSYQACTEFLCLPPAEVRLELPVREGETVDRPPLRQPSA
ncbi:MAG TPA: protein-disulfide reductase DsbD N-terminal domain-containing protein [Dehalococcoidia bacterium]|nr:protein-disulfide reductase DsbD N-terminal domain-containing protein [Dehalococcoidia bacterium]